MSESERMNRRVPIIINFQDAGVVVLLLNHDAMYNATNTMAYTQTGRNILPALSLRK